MKFLKSRPAVDCHIDLEGEVAFSNLIRKVLESKGDNEVLWREPINGVVYIDPASRWISAPRLIKGKRPERIKNLDEIPSPYLTGLFDNFFDGRLRPFLETNRGCPFRCSFCHTGNVYFQKTLTKITNTKFIIVTHHALTMSKMNRLYGVTMPEKGISQLVAVDLQKAESMVA